MAAVDSGFMGLPRADGGEERRAEVFREIVEPELPVLLRAARSITKSSADAEDLVQETVIRAYRAILDFDGLHPRAWLLTILRNTNVNMNRRRRPSLIDDWTMWDDAAPAFGNAGPASAEDVAIDKTLSEELQRGIKALDARFREVLFIVDIQGFNYTECSQILGIPVGTVMSRLSRARKRLRDHLISTSALEGRH